MVKAGERSRAVYSAALYHDSEDNAADKSRDLGYFPSLRAAVDAINAAVDPANGWFTGDVVYGFLFPEIVGKRPEYFERDEREETWFVGTDGKAVR